jgi:competence ComEA-like helix-hairpin-helix protein
MTMLKKYQQGYLSFTRKEKNGIIAILTVVLLLIVIPFLYPFFFKNNSISKEALNGDMDSLKIFMADSSKKVYKNYDNNSPNYYPSNDKPAENNLKEALFYFDPNTLSVDGWERLGVKEKIANNIQKYISKGGKFREPDDIKKIWGLRPEFVERILPFVKIVPSANAPQYENKTYPAYPTKQYEKKQVQPVNINQGDSVAFVDLPGIGPSYAKRIINFRNRLGGFYAVDQIAETFGLPDSTFQKIKPFLQMDIATIKKININTTTMDELKAHPYIRYQLANLIIQYRTQHGPYKNIEDIKKIMVVDDDLFKKIAPYLTIQ